ncbi:2OG-Fe(II) oxygenase [Paracoccus sp. SSK6]|uniref:2OG-Fe(II) oxygenase n=1 Tax=Paracoccus sp. SSK6 TaxID=3143131 RepID=UPI00321AECDE
MFQRLAPGIFYHPNFIDPVKNSEILNEVHSWNDWSAAHAGRYKDDKLIETAEIKEIRDVLVNRKPLQSKTEEHLRIEEAATQGNQLFGIENVRASPYVVSKYVKDCHIRPHTDTDFFNTPRVYTGVYYLNSEYVGGEIYFPTFDISLRPEEGSLVLFLAEYLHGVMPIKSGERYSIVWFGEVERDKGH